MVAKLALYLQKILIPVKAAWYQSTAKISSCLLKGITDESLGQAGPKEGQ